MGKVEFPEGQEEQFLYALGLAHKDLNTMPDFFVKTDPDKIRLTFRSKLEPVLRYADWVSFTISPDDFINMATNLNRIIADATKPKKPNI